MLNIFPGLLLLVYMGDSSEDGHIEQVWYHNITEKDLRHGAEPDCGLQEQVSHHLDEFLQVAAEGDNDEGDH